MLSSWDLRKRLDEKSFKIVYGQRPAIQPSRRQHQPLNATSEHKRAEIEVQARKLDLTNVDAFYQLTLSVS
jgi:hypothetical protein